MSSVLLGSPKYVIVHPHGVKPKALGLIGDLNDVCPVCKRARVWKSDSELQLSNLITLSCGS